jgi:tRNA pseudouridine38-40 synthase
MARYKIVIEYDGSSFVGWQRQQNGMGVQESIETAIKEFCGEIVLVQGSGRTDAGVHAIAQVAHFDLEKHTDANTVRDALNHHLKLLPVSILDATSIDSDFHARFSAKQRAYKYIIVNRRPPICLDRGQAWWVPVNLDIESMQEAAKLLVGNHDFTTFRAADCQSNSAVKTLDSIEISALKCLIGKKIEIRVRARSFLYHQVRNFVGSLKLVGEGRWSVTDFEDAFKAADRKRGGPTAPSEGLYFEEVIY